MATYKVIQDIEAEDKFVGPLTLKQFVFAMGGAFFVYIAVFFARVNPWLALIFLPAILVSFFMAIPWSKTQPTEVWVLAKLRFRILPKKRLWDQSGLQELVTITAPKKIEKHLTKELTPDEVKGRLKMLADTIDSRGWAIKNVDYAHQSSDERLIDLASIPRQVPEVSESDFPDIMDEQGTPETVNIDNIIHEKAQGKKQELEAKMERVRNGEPLENLDKTELAVTPPVEQPLQVKSVASHELGVMRQGTREQKLGASAHDTSRITQSSSHTTQDSSHTADDSQSSSGMTTPVRADIIELSRNNDLNVATIARQANKGDETDEVVVSLH